MVAAFCRVCRTVTTQRAGRCVVCRTEAERPAPPPPDAEQETML